MSAHLRVLRTGLVPARLQVAASAALLSRVGEGRGPATLRFHRYPVAVVIGRNQDAAVEVDLAACRASGVELARRITGGGAVAMGPGVLAWDLVLGGGRRDAWALSRLAGEALVETLLAFGVAAERPSSGSVAIGGLKVSGSAGRSVGRAVLHQATLICDLRETAPLSLLRRRTEGGRPTADPRHRVTGLADVMLPPPGLDALMDRLADAFASGLGLRRQEAEPDLSEEQEAAEFWSQGIGGDGFALAGRAWSDLEAAA